MNIDKKWARAQKAIFDKHRSTARLTVSELDNQRKARYLAVWSDIKALIVAANAAGSNTFTYTNVIPMAVHVMMGDLGIEIARQTPGGGHYCFSFDDSKAASRDKSPERPTSK
jgi:hypothetical protein